MSFGPTVDPVLLPPKIEVLAISYLKNTLSPTLVVTKLPDPIDDAEPVTEAGSVAGILRVEAAGGFRANRFQYDMQCLLHGYSSDEDTANYIADQAIALMAAARGQTVSDTVSNWYVVGVMNVVVAHRLTDPDVILPRYRAMVTWRVAGQPWNP